jgi:hypothetical protein
MERGKSGKSQDYRYPDRGSIGVPPEYTPEVLRLEPVCSVVRDEESPQCTIRSMPEDESFQTKTVL